VLLLPATYIRHKSTLVNTQHLNLVDSNISQQYTQETFFCVLLTVHLSIILAINQRNAQNLLL